jgi:hypothetical protein
MSNEHLKIIYSAERQGWQHFVTPDELWFYLSKITKFSGYWRMKHSQKRKSIWFKQKWYSQSHEISSGFTLSTPFQQDKYVMWRTISNIFHNQFLRFVQNQGGFILWFMQTMLNRTWLENLKNLINQTPLKLLIFFYTLLIWIHQTSFYLIIWKIILKDISMLRKRHFFWEFRSLWKEFRWPPWKPRSESR